MPIVLVFLRKNTRIHKIGEIHELFVLALSLVWFAGATPDSFFKEGKSAINLSNFGKVCQIWPRGYFFMLGWSAASTIIYVRPAGGPENTSNIGGGGGEHK